jgi:hypothetical protein
VVFLQGSEEMHCLIDICLWQQAFPDKSFTLNQTPYTGVSAGSPLNNYRRAAPSTGLYSPLVLDPGLSIMATLGMLPCPEECP